MMASVFYLLYVLFLAAVFGEVFSTKVADEECLKQQNKCGACSLDHFTTKIMYGRDHLCRVHSSVHCLWYLCRLSDNSKVRNEVVTAQNTIIQYGEASDVVKLFSQYTLTTSLNYFCCLNDEVNYSIVYGVIRNVIVEEEEDSRIIASRSRYNTCNITLSGSKLYGG